MLNCCTRDFQELLKKKYFHLENGHPHTCFARTVCGFTDLGGVFRFVSFALSTTSHTDTQHGIRNKVVECCCAVVQWVHEDER